MTLQFSTTYRNAILDLLDTVLGAYQVIRIYSGTIPVNPAAANSGTLLAEFDLQQPSWNPASSGSKSLANITIVSTGLATGVAGYFRLYDGAASTCHVQGDITVTGGGGAMTTSNINIVSGIDVDITQFTLAAPGA